MTSNQFTRNGITISIPKGYASFAHYLSTLRVNIGICRRTPKFAHLIPEYRASIKAALAFAGGDKAVDLPL